MKRISVERFERLVTRFWDVPYSSEVDKFLVIGGGRWKSIGEGEVYFVPPCSFTFINDIFPYLVTISSDFKGMGKEDLKRFTRNAISGYRNFGNKFFFQVLPGLDIKFWVNCPDRGESFWDMPSGQIFPPFNVLPSEDWGCSLWHGLVNMKAFLREFKSCLMSNTSNYYYGYYGPYMPPTNSPAIGVNPTSPLVSGKYFSTLPPSSSKP